MKHFVFWLSLMIAFSSGCNTLIYMILGILQDRGIISGPIDMVIMAYWLLWFLGSASVCYAIGADK